MSCKYFENRQSCSPYDQEQNDHFQGPTQKWKQKTQKNFRLPQSFDITAKPEPEHPQVERPKPLRETRDLERGRKKLTTLKPEAAFGERKYDGLGRGAEKKRLSWIWKLGLEEFR